MAVYSLFGQTGSAPLANDVTSYTLGMQFSLSMPANLTGIWFYSAPTATVLPKACCIFEISGQAQVVGTVNTSATWSGPAGSGWVKCVYDGSVALAANTDYKVCVLGGGSGVNWYAATNNYWTAGGAGQFGATSGVITAPNGASAADGQDSYIANVGTLTYPTGNFLATNYWVDIEMVTSESSLGLLQASFI
jgi:hypothetical protein